MAEVKERDAVTRAAGVVPELDEETLRVLVEGAPVGIALEDSGGRVAWANAALAALLGVPIEDCLGRELEALGEVANPPLGRVALAGDRAGVVAAWFFVAALPDAGVRESLRELLDTRAGIDPDTGVLDAGAVQRALDAEISRSRRYGNPLSVVVVEPGAGLDGGLMGVAARILKEQLRWADIVGRLGDDGFLLVLPETAADAAGALIDKVRAALAPALAGHGAKLRLAAAGWRRGDDTGFLIERALARL